MDRYANFLIVVARVTNWFDDGETELARISTAGQIRVGHAVRVVPSRARGLRRETVAAMTVSRNGKSETELRTIIGAIPQLIIAIGADGNFLSANQAVLEYTGLTREEVGSERFREVLSSR